MIKNPLLVATSLGLLSNILGLKLPDYLALSLARMGAASIALGLLTVGAGLMWFQSKRDGALVAYWTSVKLIAMPAIAFLVGKHMDLPAAQLNSVVLFAAMRERLAAADVPVPFRGAAIGLVTAGLMSLAFMGFTGLVKS